MRREGEILRKEREHWFSVAYRQIAYFHRFVAGEVEPGYSHGLAGAAELESPAHISGLGPERLGL